MSARNRFDYIDALRGWAILAVILVHVWIWTGADNEFLNRLASKGAYGVQLFYLISAFTLLLSYHRHRQNGPFNWRDYFIRRFFRVAPLFYLALCLYGPMWQFVPRYWLPEGLSLWHVLGSVTFTHGWHPFSVNAIVPGGWSMAVEMTFYILFPLFCVTVTNLKRAIGFVFISLLLGMVISDWAYQYYLPIVPERFSYIIRNFAYVYIPTAQLCVFALGFMLYFLVTDILKSQKLKTTGRYYLLGGGLFIIALLFWTVPYLPKVFVFTACFTLLIIGFSVSKNPLLINAMISRVGKLSYSLYLVHFGVIYILKNYFSHFLIWENKDLSLLMAFVAVVGISVVLSTISYNLIEKPGIRLGKQLISVLRQSV